MCIFLELQQLITDKTRQIKNTESLYLDDTITQFIVPQTDGQKCVFLEDLVYFASGMSRKSIQQKSPIMPRFHLP